MLNLGGPNTKGDLRMTTPAVSMIHCAEETCASANGEESPIKAKKTMVFDKKESEKQILVDPISLMTTTRPRMEATSVPLHLYPAKSTSLPNSASSSPCFDLAFTKHKNNKYRNPIAGGPFARQHSVALGNLERLRESHLRKSKSCGEGRACQPSVDFDLWVSTSAHNQSQRDTQAGAAEGKNTLGNKKELGGSREEKFKCGACLFLPGLGLGMGMGKGKGKAVRERKEERGIVGDIEEGMVASQRVSLEKFECVSWRSSAIINCEEDGGGGDATSNLFFDLPVELIRSNSSMNDAESPVTTGFVFEHHRKGVLKISRKSQEPVCNSSRHVRFSMSSPTTAASSSCITPRLHKARDDFNAFLEAQSV